MSIARKFLGTDRPALLSAADYLFARYAQGSSADMRQATVVTPGRRVGRRLLEILVDQAESRDLMLTPPAIETVGSLPECLYHPKRPFATELTQRLAWAETLRSMSVDQLAPVVRSPPAAADTAKWMDLADLLRHEHTELAAEGLNFDDVVRQGKEIEGFTEHERWQALRRIQEAYLRRLDALQVWDLQTARLVAVERRECATDQDIILVGTVEMTRTLQCMLDQVAEQVTILVFAPPSWKDRFDEHGCLIPAAWLHATLPIAEQHVSVVDGPAEQAAAVAKILASFVGKYQADEIVIGVPDVDLVPDLQRTLTAKGLTARWGAGLPLGESGPARLLHAVADFLAHDRFADFAGLVRHPDVADWLLLRGVESDVVQQLDEYQSEHIPYRLDGQWLGPAARSSSPRRAWEELALLTQPLREGSKSLTDWSAAILDMLAKVYGHREVDRQIVADRVVLSAFETIHEILRGHLRIPASLLPSLSASEALHWLVADVRRAAVPPPVANEAIELLGWLELPLDDAPALIVTSFNEGFVPESINSDLFLPNALRRQLGVLDNDRRYARDAYAVSVLAATRESLHWIVARRTRQGDPTIPSRLLFAVDGETAARRALHFFRPLADPAKPILTRRESTASTLAIPRPLPLAAPITKLRVTSFRDYLACKYRFYLKYVLGLEVVDDMAMELDGGTFGSLMHEVLRQFGAGPHRDSIDPEVIRHVLNHELNHAAANFFGKTAAPAVQVQVEHARGRLHAFAEAQAQWAQQGWRIEHTEVPKSGHGATEFDVDGQPFELQGRMDRIDVRAETGERVIWDYKTADTAERPEKTHRHRSGWIDLQLPLYRHLAKTLGIHGAVKLGYINLPKDISRIEFCVAEWTTADLDSADEVAREVIRSIRREIFWPPTRIPPDFSDDFAPICQDEVLVRVES